MNEDGLTNKQLMFVALRQLVQEVMATAQSPSDDGVSCRIRQATIDRALAAIAEIDRPKNPKNRKPIRRRLATDIPWT